MLRAFLRSVRDAAELIPSYVKPAIFSDDAFVYMLETVCDKSNI